MFKYFVFICLFLMPFFTSAQCAMCKAVIEGGNPEIAEAVNDGITYLMIFPYILVGGLAYLLIRHKKKMNKEN